MTSLRKFSWIRLIKGSLMIAIVAFFLYVVVGAVLLFQMNTAFGCIRQGDYVGEHRKCFSGVTVVEREDLNLSDLDFELAEEIMNLEGARIFEYRGWLKIFRFHAITDTQKQIVQLLDTYE